MKYAIILALLLTGCASTQDIKIPETVKVPIVEKCKLEEPPKPEYRFNPPYENIYEAVRDMLGDRKISEAYEEQLRVAIKGCKQEISKTP